MNIFKSAWQHIYDHFLPNERNNYKPHLVAHRSLSLYAAFLTSVKVFTLVSLVFLPQNQALSSAVNSRNILELTNYSRESYGLNQLAENNLLDSAAQAKADDMLQNQYFAHVSPDGATPWDFIKSSGYNYIIAGENLAINFYSSEGVSQAWMDSPEHKANILNKDFEDIGIGIAEGQYHGVNAIFVVQMFGTKSAQEYIPQNGYTIPTAAAQSSQVLPLPKASGIALQKPVINNPDIYLTNRKNLNISGQASGASTVYILINNQPFDEYAVIDGSFSGTVQLGQGVNTINAVAFNSSAQASPLSDSLNIKLDSTAPKIINEQITPSYSGQNVVLNFNIQADSSAVKVIASLGPNSVMLQPTDDPNTWTGKIIMPGSTLQNQMTISAYDLAGNSTLSRVATLTPTTIDNYGFLAQQQSSVNIFGHAFSASSINYIYIYFVIGLLAMLGITIAIKRDIQHIGIIAHVSGVIALAMIFWVI